MSSFPKVILKQITKSEHSELIIYYTFQSTIFGHAIIGCTAFGICYLAFENEEENAVNELKKRFPKANLIHCKKEMHKAALAYLLEPNRESTTPINIHIYGSPFQIRVWEELIKIPFGSTATYGSIANNIYHPKAFRAVGTAVGNNFVSFFIPCHRVLPKSGGIGNYRWGSSIKKNLLDWEQNHLQEFK